MPIPVPALATEIAYGLAGGYPTGFPGGFGNDGVLPDEVWGIPLHPLVVHAPVVLVPLSVLGALVLAAVPRWRGTYGWLAVALTTVALVTVPVATQSGEALEDRLDLGGTAEEKVELHEMWASRMLPSTAALWVLLIGLVLVHRRGIRGPWATVLAVLTAVAALAVLVVVIRTGHTGATAVWNPGG